jgi:sugar phosphate isomerase/epimerase
LKESIDTAAACNIPSVITHLSSGWRSPEVNDLGLSRFDALVEYAAEKGVNLAFENLRKIGNLAYIADRYEKISNVGFCYDFGHRHCYTPTIEWADVFRDRMITTHIHDNLGIKEKYEEGTDLHLLPFDGNIDYAKIMRKLNEYNYRGALVLEVGGGQYPELSPMEFAKTAFERVKRISDMSSLVFED